PIGFSRDAAVPFPRQRHGHLLGDEQGFAEGLRSPRPAGERATEASFAGGSDQAGATRPVLTSPQADKEALARKIATQDGVRQGLIGVLTSVELCRSFEVYRNRETKQLDLVQRWRKCLFLYHYSIHPRWGFMHARVPSRGRPSCVS